MDEEDAQLGLEFRQLGLNNSDLLQAVENIGCYPVEEKQYVIDESKKRITQRMLSLFMIDQLELNSKNKILDASTGYKYQTLIMAQMVRRVYALEENQVMYHNVQNEIIKRNINNITMMRKNISQGWKQQAPFDGILVMNVYEEVPMVLLEQLKESAFLVILLFCSSERMSVSRFRRCGEKYERQDLLTVEFVK